MGLSNDDGYQVTVETDYDKLVHFSTPHMSMFANNALLGGGVRVRVRIREQRKIKRRSKALLSL